MNNERPYACRCGLLLLPIMADNHEQAAWRALYAAMKKYGRLEASWLAPMITVSDGETAEQSFSLIEVFGVPT